MHGHKKDAYSLQIFNLGMHLTACKALVTKWQSQQCFEVAAFRGTHTTGPLHAPASLGLSTSKEMPEHATAVVLCWCSPHLLRLGLRQGQIDSCVPVCGNNTGAVCMCSDASQPELQLQAVLGWRRPWVRLIPALPPSVLPGVDTMLSVHLVAWTCARVEHPDPMALSLNLLLPRRSPQYTCVNSRLPDHI